MTSVTEEITKCIICDLESQQLRLRSLTTIGLPDLEGRPVTYRPHFHFQACPGCHYCYWAIDRGYYSFLGVVYNEFYEIVRTNRAYPKLARSFQMIAILEPNLWARVDANLMAAWCCDDKRKPVAASRCRNMALRDMRKGLQDADLKTNLERALVLIDTLRRNRFFRQSLNWIDRVFKSCPLLNIHNLILRFELELCNSRNSERHTCYDALGIHEGDSFDVRDTDLYEYHTSP